MRDLYTSEIESEIEEAEDSSVLLSIGDLMSGLLMFFALLFITVQIQLNEHIQKLNEKIREVEKLQQELQQYQKAFQALPQLIVQTLEGKVGGKDVLTVDPETGDVSIRDRILFDEASAELKPEGKKFLQAFIPLYSKVIFSNPEFDKQIARVIIEGHTSSKGSDPSNLNLSLQRSKSVADYILSDEMKFPAKSRFKQKLLAAGRGEIDATQNVDEPRDRKVVFRFQFRRENLVELYNKFPKK
ncbi:MAG TPA: OmpA family protein [Leptolyngbyaceae cyanobacterium]